MSISSTRCTSVDSGSESHVHAMDATIPVSAQDWVDNNILLRGLLNECRAPKALSAAKKDINILKLEPELEDLRRDFFAVFLTPEPDNEIWTNTENNNALDNYLRKIKHNKPQVLKTIIKVFTFGEDLLNSSWKRCPQWQQIFKIFYMLNRMNIQQGQELIEVLHEIEQKQRTSSRYDYCFYKLASASEPPEFIKYLSDPQSYAKQRWKGSHNLKHKSHDKQSDSGSGTGSGDNGGPQPRAQLTEQSRYSEPWHVDPWGTYNQTNHTCVANQYFNRTKGSTGRREESEGDNGGSPGVRWTEESQSYYTSSGTVHHHIYLGVVHQHFY